VIRETQGCKPSTNPRFGLLCSQENLYTSPGSVATILHRVAQTCTGLDPLVTAVGERSSQVVVFTWACCELAGEGALQVLQRNDLCRRMTKDCDSKRSNDKPY
jgi:hypothetical protein